MARFITNVIVFITVSFSLYFALGYVAELVIASNVAKNQFHLQADWHIKHDQHNEILFVGNSRTFIHVDSQLLSKELGQKTYCLAQDGREAKVLYYKLQMYLTLNKAPRKIYLQFDPYFINNRNDGTFYGKKYFLGYMFHDRLKLNHVFEDEKGFEKYEVYLPLKRYFTVDHGVHFLYNELTNTRQPNFHLYEYGSFPQEKKWASSLQWDVPPFTSGFMNFIYVDSIVNLCSKNDIDITLIYPPQSVPSYGAVDSEMLKQLNHYSDSNDLEYWNFNGSTYDNIDLFYNHTHLNRKGGELYTRQIIDSIRASSF